MKRKYGLIIICLLISLFIYLFYRTEKTVINELFISLISVNKFIDLRKSITGILSLNEPIIYSLPEGLWVFCITLTSKAFFFNIGRREITLVYVPLIFSIGLELLQFFNITNGRFDFWDIGFSVFFWVVANYLVAHQSKTQNLMNPFRSESFICILSYLIVFLVHVWK